MKKPTQEQQDQGILSVPVLVAVGDAIGIMGGWLVGTTALGFTSQAYISNSWAYLESWDVLSGLIKGAAFGAIVALAELLVADGRNDEALALLERIPENERTRKVAAAARLGEAPRLRDELVLRDARRGRQRPRDRAQHVHRREPSPFGDGPVQHDMPVQHAAQDVGNRLLHIGTGDQHAEDAGDVAGPLRAGASTFGQRHDQMRGRGRKAAIAGRLASGQRDLAMRLGKAGDRIGQEQHVAAGVAEMLGHRHRGPGAAPPHQR